MTFDCFRLFLPFCGFLLKAMDDMVFTSVRKLDFKIALAYSFSLFISNYFCPIMYGVALCSSGLIFFIVLLVHYINEGLFCSDREIILGNFQVNFCISWNSFFIIEIFSLKGFHNSSGAVFNG